MARRFKAAIINDDRTMSVHYISKKLRLGSYLFKPTKKSHELYLIDPRYSITTTTKRMGVPFRYTTFYYKRNVPKPVPMDELHGGISAAKYKMDETGEILVNDNGEKLIAVVNPMAIPAFENWDYNSITSEELDRLLDPNFVSMVAKANKKQNEQLQFYITIGIAAGLAFVIYYMMQTLPGNIVGEMLEALGNKLTGGSSGGP